MRVTQLARRASQAMSSEEASRLVSEAARRASANATTPGKRPRSLRYYTDIVAIGLASIVAATALKNRREHEERVAFLEAELARAHQDRDRAAHTIKAVKHAIVQQAPDAFKQLDTITTNKRANQDERAVALQNWLDDTFDKVLNESEAAIYSRRKKGNGDEKPKMI